MGVCITYKKKTMDSHISVKNNLCNSETQQATLNKLTFTEAIKGYNLKIKSLQETEVRILERCN